MDAAFTNIWLAHALPGNYVDPSGKALTQWEATKCHGKLMINLIRMIKDSQD